MGGLSQHDRACGQRRSKGTAARLYIRQSMAMCNTLPPIDSARKQ
jgi:hypothetical protein